MARAEFCIQPLEFARQRLLARLAGGPLLTARVAGVHKPGVAYASHPASDSDSGPTSGPVLHSFAHAIQVSPTSMALAFTPACGAYTFPIASLSHP